ncbi:MAG: methyltransferase domain-containing protein [Thermodesulfobacteriota bacterium]|nr:methyltransferase domain-containing protein [Thermodesulfobacteriota bacterium]
MSSYDSIRGANLAKRIGIYRNSYKDIDEQFVDLIYHYLRSEYRVLNAGPGLTSLHLKGKCREVVGVDMEQSIFENEDIDTPLIGDLERLNLSKNSFDMIVCRCVVEHLRNPRACFEGFSRVLKDGGLVFILTPNLFHYGTLIAKLAPLWFHVWYVKRRGWSAENQFPTYYRANRRQKLSDMMTGAGFKTVEVRMAECYPGLLDFSCFTLLFGLVYLKIVNYFQYLQDLRSNIVAVFQKCRG